MKMLSKTVAVALVAAQVGLSAQPALAADNDRRGAFAENERGVFAGARLKVQLGGKDGSKARAALMVAPTMHSRFGTRTRSSINEGLELGISPGTKPELMLAGQRVDRMSLFGEKPEKAGMSTLATVAIVAGVVLVAGYFVLDHIADEASCFHGDGGGC